MVPPGEMSLSSVQQDTKVIGQALTHAFANPVGSLQEVHQTSLLYYIAFWMGGWIDGWMDGWRDFSHLHSVNKLVL